jgi:hypothetical protein
MTPTNKNLQDLFKTYVAKSEDEEKFRKAHVISTVDNNDKKLGPKDDQFVATTKTYERDSTHHGYEAGGDEKVYSEEVLDEMSSKMKMKLGLYGKKKKMEEEADYSEKGDAERIRKRQEGWQKTFDAQKAMEKKAAAIKHADEFLKRYNKKKMEEEVEELDETSKAKLGRYINKAKDSIDMTSYRSGIKDGTAISRNDPYTSNNPLEKKLSKRHKGIEMAVKKLTREEAEQIDELSKDTYRSYADKASRDYLSGKIKDSKKDSSRGKYIDKAVGKVFKENEESEQIDELSVVGLDKYHSKAYQSMFDKDSDKKTVAKRKKGMDTAYNKAGFGKAKVYATEEADLDEATLNPEDERHFEKQTPKMQAAINLHLRKGMDYEDAVAAARRVFSEEVEQTDKLSTAIKKKLSDEGGAAAFKPLKDAAMKMGINLTPEMLKNIPGVSQHDDGDYILKEEVDLDEKKLTKAELKKREEIATAMERDNPGMDMGKKMAIATAQAKKVAEEAELDEGIEGLLRLAGKAKNFGQQVLARMRKVPPAPAGTPRLAPPGASVIGGPKATAGPAQKIIKNNRALVTTTPATPRSSLGITPKRAAAVAGAVAVGGAGGAGTYLATRDSSASAAPKAAAPKAATPTASTSTTAASPASAASAAPKATAPAAAPKATAPAAAPKAATGNSSGSYKVKGVDVTKDVQDIVKANPSITNPNMIRAGQTIKVGDSDYKVQKGDTLSGIAAGRKSSATPAAAPKAATASATPEAPKAAPTASTAPEAPKANDFSDVKSDSGPIAAKHDDHTQGYDNKSRKQIKADARAAIRTQRVLAKASKLQTTRGDEYSAAYANRKMADIAGDTEKAYGHEDQASAHYGKRAEYGRNMNIIRKNNSIAAAQANKVQEEIELGEAVNSDDAFDRLEKAGAKDVKTTSGGIRYTHGGKEYNLRHNMKRTGHRTVRSAELEQHLNRLQEETEVVEEQFAPGKFKEAMIQRGLAALQEHIVGNE